MTIELTSREWADLLIAIETRIGRIEEMLKLKSYKDDKGYKDEFARMIILKNKLML